MSINSNNCDNQRVKKFKHRFVCVRITLASRLSVILTDNQRRISFHEI